MVAGLAGLIGPQADGTTPFQNMLDTRRHEYWLNLGGKSGIVRGLVPSVVVGQMQLSFTGGAFGVCERDGSNVETDRAYPGYFPNASYICQFTAAHATLARIDAVVAAVVDVEDGAQGTGAIGVGAHIVAVPGTASGSPTAPTDTDIKNYLGRGGFHRLYNQPIAAASTQILLSGATFTGYNVNTWNVIPSVTAASGWTLVAGQQRYMFIGQSMARIRVWATRTGGTISPGSDGNFGDVDVVNNMPTFLRAITDTAYGTFHVPGTTLGSCRVETAGNITITDAYSNSSIVNTNIVRIEMQYPVV